MMKTYSDLEKRFKKAESNREMWRSTHREACEYCLPNRETFDIHSQGEDKTTRTFDSTAIEATQQFANRIQGSVIPAWQQWADLVSGDEIPEEESQRVDEGLESITKTIFAALNHSNFYQEISPALQDLAIGTGCISVESGTMGNDLRFSCIPLSQMYPERPINGVIESVWQKFKIQPNNIKATWPMAKLGEKLAKAAENPAADEVEIITGQVYDSKTGVYHHIVMSPDDKKVMLDREYSYKRFIAFRWSVTPGETFGRGPAINNLSDVKTLNKMKEQGLAAAAYAINPMMTAVSDGIFNPYTVRMQAGAIIPVGSNLTSNPTLAPLQTGNNINYAENAIASLQAQIKEAFFASPLGEIGDPIRSATEQMLRTQEMLKRSGASFGRLNSELINPVMASVVAILTSINKLPEIKIDGKLVKIKLQSPMAKAEQQEAFQNTQVWMNNAYTLLGEKAAMYIKEEDIPKITAEQLGVTTSLVRSEEERTELAKQQQAAMQQAQNAGQ
jgi:hypothetical protein